MRNHFPQNFMKLTVVSKMKVSQNLFGNNYIILREQARNKQDMYSCIHNDMGPTCNHDLKSVTVFLRNIVSHLRAISVIMHSSKSLADVQFSIPHFSSISYGECQSSDLLLHCLDIVSLIDQDTKTLFLQSSFVSAKKM